MKYFLMMAFIATSLNAFSADSNCKDKNFNGLKSGENYNQLQFHKRFTKLFSSSSPAPAGYEGTFGKAPELCYDVEAIYLKHNPSGKIYVMFATRDDYCDGGNTLGIIVDMNLYKKHKLEEAVAAIIGDNGVYCTENK